MRDGAAGLGREALAAGAAGAGLGRGAGAEPVAMTGLALPGVPGRDAPAVAVVGADVFRSAEGGSTLSTREDGLRVGRGAVLVSTRLAVMGPAVMGTLGDGREGGGGVNTVPEVATGLFVPGTGEFCEPDVGGGMTKTPMDGGGGGAITWAGCGGVLRGRGISSRGVLGGGGVMIAGAG